MSLAPIAFFAYKRPEHTRKSLESLAENHGAESSELFVFCDGIKKPEDKEAIQQVREIVKSQQWCRQVHIIEREKNMGLAKSVIHGVTDLCSKYGKVIVLEDDLVLSPFFLEYMNQSLDLYETESKVIQVSGYMFPVKLALDNDTFFLPFPTSWGWATWERAWKHFDPEMSGYNLLKNNEQLQYKFNLNNSYCYFEMLEGQINGSIDSWAIRWYLSTFSLDGLTLFPKKSLVANIGFDGSGTHCGESSSLDGEMTQDKILSMPKTVKLNYKEVNIVFKYLRSLNKPPSLLQRIKIKSQSIKMKSILKELCPPILWNYLSSLKPFLKTANNLSLSSPSTSLHTDNQDLDIYWSAEMAEILETWGEGNVWSEIQFLMANCNGRVLDIACGTGKTMEIISKFPNIEIYGIDISDLLISKALERGISQSYLKIGDATNTGYTGNFFKYSYSIGSLEHFTNEGISQFISESYRITETASFHMLPVSRSGKDEGWMKTLQSFHNNSVDWWLDKFYSSYPAVFVIDSYWNDGISVGKWFICFKNENEADRNAITKII